MNLIMSYIRYPRTRMYWSSLPGLNMTQISEAMPVNRFETLRRYLHFKNVDDIPENNCDKVIRIRPILDRLNITFSAAASPEENMSIDEMLVPFKGRSALKNYMPMKLKKWGFLIWIRAGSSGYIYKMEFYQGKSVAVSSIDGINKPGNVVIRLCEGLENTGAKVYADRKI